MAVNRLEQYKIRKDSQAKDKNEFVTCIIVNSDGQPLRLTRAKNQKLDPEMYDFCSGHMKTQGEIPYQAMLRELEEELAITSSDMVEFKYLEDIETPHRKFRGTTTHCFYLITDLSEKVINERLQKVSDPEMEKVEYLPNMETLIGEVQNGENWRILFSTDLKKQLDTISERVESRGKENGTNRSGR